ncbi:MAG: LPXTG cell wall anchor domain-containing protein, partial [Nocardioides sp.]
TRKSTTVRSSAAVTAALLMTALSAAPALADHDHGQGKSRDGGQSAAHRQDGDHSRGHARGRSDDGDQERTRNRPTGRGSSTTGADEKRGSARSAEAGDEGRGDERGNGHTPVTVCHLLGNGGYHLLTMDDNALSAHLRHGDVYPDADGACPAGTTENRGTTAPSEDLEETTTSQDDTEETSTVTDETTVDDETTTGTTTTDESRTGAVVAGVEAFAGPRAATDARVGTVAGVEATRGANRAAPVTGPLAGILPQTGAGAMLSGALVGGLGLLAGGAVLVARRRQGAL